MVIKVLQVFFCIIFQLCIQSSDCRFKISIPNNDPLRNNITVYHSCYVNNYKICIKPIFSNDYSRVTLKTACYSLSLDVYENMCATQLKLYLLDEFSCQSNYWNPQPHIFTHYTLKLSLNKRESSCQKEDCFKNSIIKMTYFKPYPPKLECTSNLSSTCPTFGHTIMSWHWLTENKLTYNVCPVAKEIVTLLDFPIAVASFYGMNFKLSEPSPANYDYAKFYKRNNQLFTLSMWFMLEKPCLAPFCALLNFISEDDYLTNPLISLTNSSFIIIQGSDRVSNKFLGGQVVADLMLHKWYRLILHWTPEYWRFWLYDSDILKINNAVYRYPAPVKINITRNFGYLGSSVAFNGVEGYFGHTVWFHAKLIPLEKVLEIKAPDYITEFMTHLIDLKRDCSNSFREINHYVKRYWSKLEQRSKKTVCHNWFASLFAHIGRSGLADKSPQCSNIIWRPKLYKFVTQLLNERDAGEATGLYSYEKQLDKPQESKLATYLYDTAMKSADKHGIKDLQLESRYFKDSFCYGNGDAGFLLSTLYYYGIGNMTLHPWKAHIILMRNAIASHRLSLIALAAQFNFGHGITPTAAHPAFMYYREAALWTQSDTEKHSDDDVILENVRLTNEIELNEQTDENGDLYHWIKHQAELGIPWAKKRLALMYYWGSQGVKRDFKKAYNMLKKAAESPENSETLFDIAMLKLKGKGADQNVTEATEMLNQMANNNDPRALNTLGWAAEVFEKNSSKAVKYYALAYKHGSTEAGYNMGTFYHSGKLKEIPKNKIRAFHLFKEAALKAMIHAGILYAEYLNKGIEGHFSSDSDNAVIWMQFIAERNAKIGILLRKGVKAYRSKRMLTSILYYLMSAYTGHEIGSFNSALLCDENYDDLTNYISRECVYRHFNQSVQRELHQTDSYALIKMGDYYWYGCTGVRRDIMKSIDFYYLAAMKKEPQGFFNLAFAMEQGENISSIALRKIGLIVKVDRYETIYQLYKKCEALSPSNTYLPCQLAASRIYVKKILSSHADQIKMILCAVILLISFIGVIFSRRI